MSKRTIIQIQNQIHLLSITTKLDLMHKIPLVIDHKEQYDHYSIHPTVTDTIQNILFQVDHVV